MSWARKKQRERSTGRERRRNIRRERKQGRWLCEVNGHRWVDFGCVRVCERCAARQRSHGRPVR